MIADTRARIAAHLAASPDAPSVAQVWDYLPDDVAALPAVVVDYVDGNPNPDVGALGWDLAVAVMVIGRRIGDANASAQLDTVADEVLVALTVMADGNVRQWRGRTLQVAGVDVPAYIFTIDTTALTDCSPTP